MIDESFNFTMSPQPPKFRKKKMPSCPAKAQFPILTSPKGYLQQIPWQPKIRSDVQVSQAAGQEHWKK